MRRALALVVAASALAFAGAAAAEHWTKYVDVADNPGAAWSYDADYSYKDSQTGRLVVMQAISKGQFGPGAPGKADGVGNVYAIDCAKKNVIQLGSYKPSAPLAIKSNWRSDTPKKMDGAEDMALIAAVCPHIDHVPVK